MNQGGQARVAGPTYAYPQPASLPGWVQTVTQAIDWVSSLFPSGGPSDSVSTFLYITISAAVGALAASIPSLRRRLARRAERIAADEAMRKLEAKKLNEHLKMISSFCNTVGAAVIGAAFIVPYIGNHVDPAEVNFRWVGVGLAFPLAGHIALRFMKSE